MGFIDKVLKGFLGDKNAGDLKEVKKVVAKIKAIEEGITQLSDDGLREKTASFKEKLKAATANITTQIEEVKENIKKSGDLKDILNDERVYALYANNASSISDSVAIPVEIIIGFPLDATYSIRGISVISKDAILYAGTFIPSRKSTAVKSKGDEKNISPSSSAISFSLGCQSHGV